MIGGADMVLSGRTTSREADLILRALRTEWPDGMVQRADEADAKPLRELRFPIVERGEFIVYRDRENSTAWREKGATPENADAMIHFIVADDCVTVVIDRADSPLARLAKDILSSLANNRASLARAA
jgi:hypothetical protein